MTDLRAPAAAAVLVFAAGLWFALRPDAGPPSAADVPEPTRTAHTPPPSAQPPPTTRPSAAPSRPAHASPEAADDTDAPADAPPRVLGPVDAYRRYAVYPPTSRPLTAHQADLIDWNRRHEAARSDPEQPDVQVLFTADRFHLVGAQTLSPVLDVRRDGEPIGVDVLDGHVALPDGRQVAFELTSADGVHAGVIDLSTFELTEPTRVEVRVAFDFGAGRRAARLFAHYTPDGSVPARFAGPITDAVVDGSLRVAVPVDVVTPGLFIFDANLFADGQPVAWTRFKGRLEPGPQTVALVFFGKALVDGGHDGPYTVEQLRGVLAAPDRMPSTVQMPPYDGAITTAAYTIGEFSAAEWDAPEKRDRLRRLKRLAARGGPQITTPVAPPP